jgi:hypothetical protein
MFQDMLAKHTVKALIDKRERATEIDEKMDVLIGEPIDINPMRIVQTSWTGTQIDIHGTWAGGGKAPESPILTEQEIHEAHPHEVKIPADQRKDAMREKIQDKIAHRSVSVRRHIAGDSLKISRSEHGKIEIGVALHHGHAMPQAVRRKQVVGVTTVTRGIFKIAPGVKPSARCQVFSRKDGAGRRWWRLR